MHLLIEIAVADQPNELQDSVKVHLTPSALHIGGTQSRGELLSCTLNVPYGNPLLGDSFKAEPSDNKSVETPEMMDKCAVYLMRDGHSGDVKIGISNNPDLRRTQVQSHYNVGTVSLIDQTWFPTRDEARQYESAFHSRYSIQLSPARGGREWFNLTQEQIDGFLTWMKASTQSRVYRVRTLCTKIWKTNDEVRKDRWSGFWTGLAISLLTGCVPTATYLLTSDSTMAIISPAGVGGICALRVKKDKKITKQYGDNGNPLSEDFPHYELIKMNLWENKNIDIPDYSISNPEGFPDKIPGLGHPAKQSRFPDDFPGFRDWCNARMNRIGLTEIPPWMTKPMATGNPGYLPIMELQEFYVSPAYKEWKQQQQ